MTTEWAWNSDRLVYKIYERNPHLVLQQNNLQIICAKSGHCGTGWLPKEDRGTRANVTTWFHNVYTLHLVNGGPAFRNKRAAQKDNSIDGYAARLIMNAAGIL